MPDHDERLDRMHADDMINAAFMEDFLPKFTITVCAACLKASCWQGLFFCDQHKEAGTVEMTIEELQSLNLEHPGYWK